MSSAFSDSGHSTQVDKDIAKAPYYHGLLPREDMKTMLLANGDFLVRTTEPHPGEKRACVISVMVDERKEEHGIKHYIVRNVNGKYTLGDFGFKSVTELVDYYANTGQPIVKVCSLIGSALAAGLDRTKRDPPQIGATPVLGART